MENPVLVLGARNDVKLPDLHFKNIYTANGAAGLVKNYRKKYQDIYHTSIRINEAHNSYFSEEYRESVLASFDYAYQDIFRIIRNDRSKSRKLSRRLGARVKRMFKKI